MKNLIIFKAGCALLLLFMIFACRQEALLTENPVNDHKSYHISYLNKSQVDKNLSLTAKLASLKNKNFKSTNALSKGAVQDSILEGAIIETERVLEIEEDGHITYTFPVSRTFPNRIVENLVVRKNHDSTYTGILVQYHITALDYSNYMNGSVTDFGNKTKVYAIENLNVNDPTARTEIMGCFEVVWEDHPCTNGGGHSYGQSCTSGSPANVAQPSTIVAFTNLCYEGGGGGTGSSGPGTSGPGPGSAPATSGGGGSNSGNTPVPPAFNSFMFLSYDDIAQMCLEDDINCPAAQLYNGQIQAYFSSLGYGGSLLGGYDPIWAYVHSYFETHAINGDTFLSDRLTLIGNWYRLQNRSTEELRLANSKFAEWALNYFMNINPSSFEYYKSHPSDFTILYMENVDAENAEFADASANVISDILINQENDTLSSLDISWPNLETLKQKVIHAISFGIYTSAKYTRNYLYLPMYKLGIKYPSSVYWSNKAIDKIRIEAVTPLVNFNENTMSWGDLFNIWLFELTPSNFPSNTINYTGNSNVVNGNNVFNPATNAVKNFPKGNWIDPSTNEITTLPFIDKLKNGLDSNIYNIGSVTNGYFNYNVNAFYSTLSNGNAGIQMLGSYPIKATVISKTNNSAVVQFYIYNFLGWASATRFIKGANGSGNIGIVDDKVIGTGLHLGGTIKNNFTWTEIVTF